MAIGAYAFYNCESLRSVALGNGITKVSDFAFYNCKSLTTVMLGDNITSIGDSAFYGCSKLANVSMPNSLEIIGNSSFYGCMELINIMVPESVMSIGARAFYDCKSLRSITIGNSVTNIGYYAFSDCVSLEDVIIGKNVANITDYTFFDCGKLTSIVVSPDNLFYSSTNGILLTKDGKTLIRGIDKNTIVPEGVESLGNGAFSYYASITSVTIPSSVTNIGTYAFSYTTNLIAIVFTGNSPLTVDSSAFTKVNSSCTVKVPFGSSGWGVDIPGVWHGLKIDYTIPVMKFNSNGGILEEAERITDNGLVGELPVPSREGYSFSGWFTAVDGGEIILPGMTIDESIRVYAHWAANRYVVELNPNGGALEPSNSTVEVVFDSKYGELPCPVRVGYSFAGWARSLIDGTVIDKDTLATTNQILYALWKANQYQIIYDANDGSGETYIRDAVYDEDTEIVANPFTRIGHVVLGWATSADGAMVYEPRQIVRNLTDESTGGVALYAVWGLFDVATPVIGSDNGTSFVGDTCLVTISCATDGTDIYFSTKGTPPRIRESNRYTGAFTITNTTQIIAIAVRENVISEVAVATISRRILTLPEAAGVTELAFETGGDAEWLPMVDATSANGFSIKSGEIGCAPYGSSNITWLATEVAGAGTFSFRWKVDCEHDYTGMCLWDHLAVFTNGVEATRIDGSQDWADVSFLFADGDTHSVRWVFVKDDEDDDSVTFEDCGWVSGVSWVPAVVTADREYGIGEMPEAVSVRPGVMLSVKIDHEPIESEIVALGNRITIAPKSEDQKAEYFKVVGSYDAMAGSVALKVVLDDEAIDLDETAQEVLRAVVNPSFVSGVVSLNDVKSGLYYGIVVVDELSKMESASAEITFVKAATDGVTLTIPKPEGPSAFFKIVVSDEGME